MAIQPLPKLRIPSRDYGFGRWPSAASLRDFCRNRGHPAIAFWWAYFVP